MPWAPELFSAPVLQRLLDKYHRDRLRSVPFFDGVVTGEVDALVGSFAGTPEVHDPVRGRIRGERSFRRYLADLATWMASRGVEVEDVNVLLTPPRGIEEVVLHLGTAGRLPLAVVADHDERERIVEMRIYFSAVPLMGRRVHRPPLLGPGTDRVPDVVGRLRSALAAGDVEATLAAFEPDGCVRRADGGVHRGRDALRELYQGRVLGDDPAVLELCTVTEGDAVCAVEHNVLGGPSVPPRAALTVLDLGTDRTIAMARIYDDAGPPEGALA
ncbi:nuclear transport factor 2 family protein [Cellulomonas fengjieae]|uniref:nuclear transport factor 2 family protein n=1 Tax=Cellulomonas fengjieae TaxID=2819978 RepID=UPI001AAFEBCA|nr:nuclear transport factor 2 family protein [Cellulomonas fengjieae]MBO3101904.1 hypothetical protein [Cellulomonas fengjieae]